MANYSDIRYEVTGTDVYAAISDLPLSGVDTGTQAFVSGTNRLYMWTGTGWYNIALINTDPSLSGASATYNLNTDGSNTVVTLASSDPEGIPISFTVSHSGLGVGANAIATVTQSNNIFTFTPTTNTALTGTFTSTFTASDGVNVAVANSSFTLAFVVNNSNYTTALITSVGTNTQDNNDFVDSSTNSHTITAAGNVTQNTFSPYRHGGYSYYWDGSGTDYFQILSPTAALDFGTGDFTIEMQIWLNDLSAGILLIDTRPSETNGNQYFYSSILTDGNFKLGSNNADRITTTGGPITAGSWHHIALQRNSGTLEAYVDGSRNATASFTQSLDASRWSLFKNSFASGGVADGGGGYIKDYRVVKGTAVYSGSTYDVPTEPLTAISGTSFLLFSSYYFEYEPAGTESITWTNGMYEPFAPYDYATYASSDHGGSMYFDGSGDTLSLPQTSLDLGSNNFTIEAYVYTTATSQQAIAGSLVYSNGTGSWLLAVNYNSKKIRFFMRHGGGTVQDAQFEAGTFPTNAWVHVAVTRDGANLRAFINGTQAGTTNTALGSNAIDNALTNYYIGDNQDGNMYWNGYITDLRVVVGTAVYTSAFTPPTAPLTAITNTSLLLSGTNAGIIDKSQSVKSIALNGNVSSSTAQTKYLSSSMYFDGTGDSLTFGTSSDYVWLHSKTIDYTIEFWMYAASDVTTRQCIIETGASSGSSGIMVDITSGTARLNIYRSVAGSLTVAQSSSASISVGQWHHVAFSVTTSDIKAFVDGTLESTTTWSLAGSSANSQGSLSIGGSPLSAVADFTGYLSDVRITKGLARYTANFTPPTTALLG